jgi:diguanylate cyclase (GGDEF)-like protein
MQVWRDDLRNGAALRDSCASRQPISVSWGTARAAGLHNAKAAEGLPASSRDSDADADADVSVRILLVEDSPVEAELLTREIHRGGIKSVCLRVDTEPALRAAVRESRPDIILSDFSLPCFDGLSALKVAREIAPDLPFVFVSGTIGEERAIEALKCGAIDYVLKNNLARLGPAVLRALEEARAGRRRRRQEAQIAHLTRVLRMLSGINGAVLRIRDRNELFDEACRLAVAVGGYAAALVALQRPGTHGFHVVSTAGPDERAAQRLRTTVAGVADETSALMRRVLETGSALVHDETNETLVALPLVLDKTAIGALALAAPKPGSLSEEELKMLREVAANLSYALRYLRKGNEVHFLSYFDPLTGLAKRPLFCERIKRLVGRAPSGTPGAVPGDWPPGTQSTHGSARGGPGSHAVAVLDIERLSVINDSIGRHSGDRLLQLAAERLRRHFGDTECVAHFGGGTFAVAREATADSADLGALLQEKLATIFNPPFELEGRAIPLMVKSGVALYPQDGSDAHSLVQNAEAALQNARAGGQRHRHYSTQERSEVVAQLALEHELRNAIERRQFELHYQPIMSLATRRIDGAEALIRWRHPHSGLIAPTAFLPLLESSGLILQAGDWVVEQAARDRQQWQQLALPAGRIAVNISPAELRRPDFAQRFLSRTQSWSNALCGLDIEITEGALLDDSATVVGELQRLRDAGICIAIDDFGTGYSSLSRLSELPIDRLKIDRSFITRLPHDPAGRTLVSTIITLGHAFGMTLVAEGVETAEQLGVLCELGCDRVQGFVVSRPVAGEAFADLLKKDNGQLLAK